MNPYVKNLKRIEFVVTSACTGRCKHCSQGDHKGAEKYIDAETAEKVVRQIADKYNITSVMTFGGEPLLHPETVYAVHKAAFALQIPKRQLISNGFFSKDSEKIKEVAGKLAESGVNAILLSVDAFHQETIPLKPVKEFATELMRLEVPLRVQPAWLVSEVDENPYNVRTRELLAEFEGMGISCNEGNVIFPSGNALKYFGDYFDLNQEYSSPYEENPTDIRAICISPNGDVLDGNVYETDILTILENYRP